jgi:myo-inositol-1(or 4)-monophosphatase
MSNTTIFWPNSADALAELVSWVRQAGDIALSYFRKIEQIQFKEDKTFVTQADVEVEAFLVERLRAAYPDYGLIAEEGARGPANPAVPYTWAVDPVDGTTAFTQGVPGWGVAVGLLHRQQPCFGLFYMPLLDDLTCTAFPPERSGLRSEWGPRGFLAVSASSHRNFEFNLPYLRTLGSAGAGLVYTARGSATAAFLPRVRLWDLVAGAAILHQAGGELCYLSGAPIDYAALAQGQQAPESVIAGHPNLLAGLQQAIIRRRRD